MREADVIGTYQGYECRYDPDIMAGPVFRWTSSKNSQDEVSASRKGVLARMSRPLQRAELGRLMTVIRLARTVGAKLREMRSGESIEAIKAYAASAGRVGQHEGEDRDDDGN